ncbi:hypothetical protein AK812_SmicGene9561 [Symbiodinium microadriaticum]|uniref:Uncharacterized protein n=1 Tax=Symbiodinium microadriaticum TaxID=2951 RepID=A0A1Q9EI09_SYMMI|nr:hypothetical protein AK812_SmicGene9561 [Symbiodinium microadriaticum]CAE7650128.1 unnamed protein product [Symbiodinium sp. KB8]CAE7844253.1 unnamed protein product [Symbiodinium microadriaticum]
MGSCCASAPMADATLSTSGHPKEGDPLLAPSVHYLETGFCEELEAAGFSRASRVCELEQHVVRAKGAQVLCPRDGRLGAAFVDTLTGSDNVGHATHMLSYTWQYTVDSIIGSLSAFCQRKSLIPEQTYVWMCFMGVNQHRIQESRLAGSDVPFEQLAATFGGRVRSIGKVIALMEPWRAPRYCHRAWCVFELHTASEQPDCTLEIVMPPAEAESYARAIFEGSGLQEQWRTLAQTQLQKAQASVTEDRDMILRLVEHSPGFSELNRSVVHKLQSWFADVAHEQIQRQMESTSSAELAKGCLQVAELFRSLGNLDTADGLLQRAADVLQASCESDTSLGAALLGAKGHVARERGDLDEAARLLFEAYDILQEAGSLESVEAAQICTRIGHVKLQSRDLEAAESFFNQALQAHQACDTLSSYDGGALLQSLGHIQRERQDLPGALVSYEQAHRVLCTSEQLDSPQHAALLASIGHIRRLQLDFQGALEFYSESRQVMESIGTFQTAHGAALLVNVGHVLRSQGQLDTALATYKEARLVEWIRMQCSYQWRLMGRFAPRASRAGQLRFLRSQVSAPRSRRPSGAAGSPWRLREGAAPAETLLQRLRNWGHQHSKAIGFGGYVLLTVQWCMDDVLLLRCFGVACASSMAVFLFCQPVPLMVPVRFNLLFIAINAYHIGKILMHRRDLKLDEVEQMLWDAGFSEFLTKVELRELLAQGKRYSAEEGMVVAKAGMPVLQKVIALAKGGIVQMQGGKAIASIAPGDFWGEFQLVERARNTGVKHKITTVFSKNSIAVEWDAAELNEYLSSKPALKNKLQELFAEGLNWKFDRLLCSCNTDAAERAYVDILRGILCSEHASIGETEMAFLNHVRQVNDIQHDCHLGALAELGYSEKEFADMVRKGQRPWFLRWLKLGRSRSSLMRSQGLQPEPKYKRFEPAFLPVQTPGYWPDLNVHLSGRDESQWSDPAHRSEEVKRRVSNPSFGKLIEEPLSPLGYGLDNRVHVWAC